MVKHNNIVIIGGTACGPKAAARARRCDQEARITIIEQGDSLSTATCGLPYYISGVIENENVLSAIQPNYFQNIMDTQVLTRTKALAIDRKAHTVDIVNLDTKQHSTMGYDRLILATGSTPMKIKTDRQYPEGIFTLTTIGDANAIRNYIRQLNTKEVVIVGAGLIGLEMAESFVSLGLSVTILEALDWILPKLLDFEVVAYVEKHLRDCGVKVLFGQRVTGFLGDENGRVSRVITSDTEYEAGLVLLSLGVRPEVSLARDAGLTIGTTGGISVNQYLQTNDPDIYAGGDCVENVNLITSERMLAPMGSTANKHGRTIGTNITGGSETFPGVLGTAIAKVFDYNVGRVGLTESQAQETGYDTVMSLVPSNEHATYYPGNRNFLVKLIAAKTNNKLLGVQVVGPGDTAKRIDVLVTALTFGATTDDLANLDLAYAPPYNSAMEPLHNAANVIGNKQSGYARTLNPMEVRGKLDNGDDFVLLDVRSQGEWDMYRVEARQARLLPLPELRQRLGELSRDEEIVIICLTSIRAYQAQLILDNAGFKDVKFVDGSIMSWPYDVYYP